MAVLVAGANGRTGKEVVSRLLARDYEVKAMVRREEDALPLEDEGVESVIADLRYNFESALEGCEAVISAVGAARASGRLPKFIFLLLSTLVWYAHIQRFK